MTDDASPSNSITSISGGVNLDAGRIDIGGDVVGRDKIIHNIQNIDQRARTAAEEAEQARSFEAQHLAQGVSAFAQRLQARAAESNDADKGGPYKGLLEYHLSDAEIFFGRDTAIRELLEHLQRGPLTVLHAESGAGKTSLLQAGISPRLIAAGHLPIYLRPYNVSPSLVLKRAFLPNLTDTPNLAQAPLRDFLSRVCDVLGTTTTLYILLDQFEEFFTQLEETDRTEFVRELAECLDDESLNVRWVPALRSEFFGNLAGFRPRIRKPFENDYRLTRLTHDEARDAVTKPATRRDISFEEGLIDTILNDLGEDEVEPPQLQLVCATLYEELDPEEKIITQARYDREGGAAGILRSHLERVLSRDLPPEQRPAARRLLESLISSEQQRIIRTDAELIDELSVRGVTPQTLNAILNQLTDSRLLKVGEAEEGLAYELAHDYLLSEIRLDPEVQARKAAQELLEQEVRAYRRYKTLLTADRLQVIEPYVADLLLTPEAQQLLADSRTAVQREHEQEEARRQKELDDARRMAASQRRAAMHLRWVVIVLVLGIAGSLVGGVIATQQRDEAQRQARIARSRELTAKALPRLEDQLDLALLLSVEAERAADTVEARSNLLSGLQRSPRLQAILQGHTSSVTSVAFSPDGMMLASAGCGKFDDLVCTEGVIILWKVTDPTGPQMLGKPLTGHTGSVESVAFSPDGKTLASASCGKLADRFCTEGVIKLWDVSNPTAPQALGKPLTDHTAQVLSVAFSLDGKTLASSSEDRTIILWDVSNPTAPQVLGLGPLTGHNGSVESVAFSPDGKTLASASGDKTIILWDVSNPTAPQVLGLGPLTGHNGSVESVAFSPDGKTLASGSGDRTVILWDVSNPQAPQALGEPLLGYTDSVESVAFSPDGRTLASGSCRKLDRSLCTEGVINLWDVSNPTAPWGALGLPPLIGHTRWVSSVAFSPDGRTLASGSYDRSIILWHVSNPRAPQALGAGPLTSHTDWVSTVAFSPDGRTLASGSADKTIILWDVTNPQAPLALSLRPLAGHTDFVWSVAFSPDGKMLASGGLDGTIILWDVSNPTAPQMLGPGPLVGHIAQVSSVAFSPDGKTLASAGCGKVDGTVCTEGAINLWDVSNPTAPRALGPGPLTGHTSWVSSVAFSPDGKTLASGSGDRTIILWDVSNPTAPQALGLGPLTDHTDNVWSVAFSPDGKMLASGSSDWTIILWDVTNPQAPQALGSESLTGHTDLVHSVAFSPDGKTLASGSGDKTIILWDVTKPTAPQPLGKPLLGHTDSLLGAAFSPDGKTLASGSYDGSIILWDVDPVSWQARACRIVGRNLTHAEWQHYMGDEPYRKTCEQWPLEPEVTPTSTP